MYAEYFFSFIQVGQVDVYLAVETSGAQQCLVQYIHTVGCGKDDDTAVGTEPVHFRQQLVQGVFAFIVTAHGGSFSTGASYGIDFIDEYDARCFLFGLTEQVADAGSTYADKHFHKVGTGQ